MKHLASQQYSQNPYQFTLRVYQAGNKSLSRLMRSSKRKYETGIASLARFNPKVFFAHVRWNRQLNRQIISLGVIVKEPEVQTELLNEFYDAAFRTDNGQPISALPIPSVMMGIPVFTPCLVHKELSTLDISKGPTAP